MQDKMGVKLGKSMVAPEKVLGWDRSQKKTSVGSFKRTDKLGMNIREPVDKTKQPEIFRLSRL